MCFYAWNKQQCWARCVFKRPTGQQHWAKCVFKPQIDNNTWPDVFLSRTPPPNLVPWIPSRHVLVYYVHTHTHIHEYLLASETQIGDAWDTLPPWDILCLRHPTRYGALTNSCLQARALSWQDLIHRERKKKNRANALLSGIFVARFA